MEVHSHELVHNQEDYDYKEEDKERIYFVPAIQIFVVRLGSNDHKKSHHSGLQEDPGVFDYVSYIVLFNVRVYLFCCHQ